MSKQSDRRQQAARRGRMPRVCRRHLPTRLSRGRRRWKRRLIHRDIKPRQHFFDSALARTRRAATSSSTTSRSRVRRHSSLPDGYGWERERLASAGSPRGQAHPREEGQEAPVGREGPDVATATASTFSLAPLTLRLRRRPRPRWPELHCPSALRAASPLQAMLPSRAAPGIKKASSPSPSAHESGRRAGGSSTSRR